MGNIGDPRCVPDLINVLNTDEENLKIAVIYALGDIRSSECIDALINALTDNNPDIRRTAVSALGKIGGSESIFALINILKGDEPDLKSKAVKALKDIDTVEVLEQLITNNEINIYENSIFGLVRDFFLRHRKGDSPYLPIYSEIIRKFKPSLKKPKLLSQLAE